MRDEDLFNGVQDPEHGDKVSRKRLLELGAAGAAAVAGAGLLSGSGRAFAAALAAGSLPYTAHTGVKGSITFWHFWGSKVRRPVIEGIVADFQKAYPGVSVNAQYIPFGGIYQKLIAAVAAGQGMPDAIIEDRLQLTTRARLKIDINMAGLAKRDKVNFSGFWPSNAQQALVGGAPYGLPYETDTRVMFYNKTAFQQAGLDPNKPPWTGPNSRPRPTSSTPRAATAANCSASPSTPSPISASTCGPGRTAASGRIATTTPPSTRRPTSPRWPGSRRGPIATATISSAR